MPHPFILSSQPPQRSQHAVSFAEEDEVHTAPTGPASPTVDAGDGEPATPPPPQHSNTFSALVSRVIARLRNGDTFGADEQEEEEEEYTAATANDNGPGDDDGVRDNAGKDAADLQSSDANKQRCAMLALPHPRPGCTVAHRPPVPDHSPDAVEGKRKKCTRSSIKKIRARVKQRYAERGCRISPLHMGVAHPSALSLPLPPPPPAPRSCAASPPLFNCQSTPSAASGRSL